MRVNINGCGSTVANIESDDVELLARLVAISCDTDPDECDDDGISNYYRALQNLKFPDGGHFYINEHMVSRIYK